MPTTASAALIPFVSNHEGRVLKAYRDAGGVVTIGIGFTMLSRSFASYWLKTRRHALRMGDTITVAEAEMLLGRLIDEEYAPPVAAALGDQMQHRFDAAVDVSFNCGPKALKWQWAKALAAGSVDTAATKLRVTAITAGGRTLSGLKRRRADEAHLLETGDYGQGAAIPAHSISVEEVKAYQKQLATLGLYEGAIDGIVASSDAAVKKFQNDNDLAVDGVMGPATCSAIARRVAAKSGTRGAVAGGLGSATISVPHDAALDWGALVVLAERAAAVAAFVILASLVWRFRGLILRRRTPA